MNVKVNVRVMPIRQDAPHLLLSCTAVSRADHLVPITSTRWAGGPEGTLSFHLHRLQSFSATPELAAAIVPSVFFPKAAPTAAW